MELAVLSFITPVVPVFLKNIAGRWSRNVTSIYCIHWVLITWLTFVIPVKGMEMLFFILLMLMIVALSDWGAAIYAKWKGGKSAN